MKKKKDNKSHYRDCKRKVRFNSDYDALKNGKKHGMTNCYYCEYCNGYHLTSRDIDYELFNKTYGRTRKYGK